MGNLKLIYFKGCPNAKHARAVLLQTGVNFEVVIQDELPQGDKLLQFSSPTIIRDHEILLGQKLTEGSSACSFEKIDEDQLKNKMLRLDNSTQQIKTKSSLLTTIGSFGSALTIGLCPVCIPAIGAFLSAIGLGFLINETVLKPVLLIFLAIALFGYFWSYLKEHKNILPFIVGSLMAIALYVGRYVYISGTLNLILMYGGLIGIMAVSIWNWRLRKNSKNCASCGKH